MSYRPTNPNIVDSHPAYQRPIAPEECPDVAIAQKIADHINSGVSMLFAFSARVYVSPRLTIVTVFVHEENSRESYSIDVSANGEVSFEPARSRPRLAELYRIVKMVHERTKDPIGEDEEAQKIEAERLGLSVGKGLLSPAEAGRLGGQAKVRNLSPEAVAALTARMRASRWGRVDRLTEAVMEQAGMSAFVTKVEEMLAGVAVSEMTRQVVRKRLADRILKRVKPEVGDENVDA